MPLPEVIRKEKIVNTNLVDPMNTKVKGLLKGLRYISQIFEVEKEQEMQIGLPTDVKHVAHIGCDGPSVNATPVWMNDFHSQPLPSSATISEDKELLCSPRSASQEIPTGGDLRSPKAQRRPRRHASSESVGIPEGPKSPKGHRPARRQGSESAAEGSRRSGRRSSKTGEASTSADNGVGSESPARDLPTVPKQARRRKTKTGSDGGSTRSSARSKNPSFSDSDPGPDDKTTQSVTAI